MDKLLKAIDLWAIDRKLDKADSSKQFLKVAEEVGEIADALARNDMEELEDAIGDTVVTLNILAKQNNLTLKQCTKTAYSEIKDRKGEMRNGTFIKEEDLK